MSERTYSKLQNELPSGGAEHTPDLNDIQTQSSCLHSLLSALYEASTGYDYASSPNPAAVKAADQVTNLAILARDEAERLDAAISAYNEARCHAPSAPSFVASIIVDPAIIDPAKLSIDQMFGLFDALGTVFDIMSGLLCQPKFQGQDGLLNPPGDMLDRLQEAVGDARDAIRREVLARKATDKSDLGRQVFFAAEKWVDGSCGPEPAIKGLTKALSSLGKAVRS